MIRTEENIFSKEEKIKNLKYKINGLEKELKNITESESDLSEYTKQRFITARKLGDEYLKLSDLKGSLLLREKAKTYYR